MALARILAAKPQALLLDEPFSALDTHLRGEIQAELSRFLTQFSGPCLMVTHSQDDVRRLCDQVCVVHDGVSQAVQTTEEFFNYPRTRSACQLMGCPNLSPVERQNDGTCYAVAWGIPVQVPPDAAYVTIQPHHVCLAQGPGQNRLACTVAQTEERPFSVSVCLNGPTGPLWMEAPHEVWAGRDQRQEIWVELPPAQLLPLTQE